MASKLVKALIRSQILPSTRRHFSAPATTQLGEPTDDLVGNHTKKWMQDLSKKSPMELINEVPPIKVKGRTAACEGARESPNPIADSSIDEEALQCTGYHPARRANRRSSWKPHQKMDAAYWLGLESPPFTDELHELEHFAHDLSKKSPMELINEVPPIKVKGRTAACEGDTNPALGHPIEFICLDLHEPAVCKYCGLRYVQDHHH
ncbi:hypothetical protein F2Q69_00039278 [Brassica cretica]|uniref:Zinc finger CHCC-type domain-containing protein n=1 Tax=Brassica cretica TaxID=69181 RepID=A0A8S9SGL9_BRACR|nr:hypothetical protein F2Q69_00039278 [Brassica cretica]